MKIATVGIDLAKNVFQVHAVDERGTVVLRRQLRRDQMTVFFANQPPCVIGMEACGSAHHWARTLKRLGHDAWLMSPQFVKPYVKCNKNDVADAEAICEAVARPNMRFVPVKSIEQQAVLARSARRLPRRSGEPPAWNVRSSGATGAANGCFLHRRGPLPFWARNLLSAHVRRRTLQSSSVGENVGLPGRRSTCWYRSDERHSVRRSRRVRGARDRLRRAALAKGSRRDHRLH